MAIIFEIEHTTTYKYANPVTFGQYRAMFLPRPASRGRLLTRCGFPLRCAHIPQENLECFDDALELGCM
jgi:hypothetical protein